MAFPPSKQPKFLSSLNPQSPSSAAVAAIQAHMASISQNASQNVSRNVSQNPTQPQHQALAVTSPPSYHHTGDPTLDGANFDISSSDQDYEEESEILSRIEISISVPLTVRGDSNHVHVDSSLSASKIATAVVAALKQASMCEGGVPMVDEEGRPRPIQVQVQAETRVEGNDNVVGVLYGKQVGEETNSGEVAAKELAGDAGKVTNVKSMIVDGKEQGMKRERADSEPVEKAGTDGKRVRRE